MFLSSSFSDTQRDLFMIFVRFRIHIYPHSDKAGPTCICFALECTPFYLGEAGKQGNASQTNNLFECTENHRYIDCLVVHFYFLYRRSPPICLRRTRHCEESTTFPKGIGWEHYGTKSDVAENISPLQECIFFLSFVLVDKLISLICLPLDFLRFSWRSFFFCRFVRIQHSLIPCYSEVETIFPVLGLQSFILELPGKNPSQHSTNS